MGFSLLSSDHEIRDRRHRTPALFCVTTISQNCKCSGVGTAYSLVQEAYREKKTQHALPPPEGCRPVDARQPKGLGTLPIHVTQI